MTVRNNVMVVLRIIAAADEIPEVDRTCTCCNRRLSGKVAWLELDQRTGKSHDHGGGPADKSQGWFPCGLRCARNEVAKAEAP